MTALIKTTAVHRPSILRSDSKLVNRVLSLWRYIAFPDSGEDVKLFTVDEVTSESPLSLIEAARKDTSWGSSLTGVIFRRFVTTRIVDEGTIIVGM
jgi:hypothetical protein